MNADSIHLLKMLEPAVRPPGSPAPNVSARRPIEQQSFDQILKGTHRPVKLSAHAQQRLREQGVTLSTAQMAALEQAVDRSEARGGRDTLLLMDRLGLIVNVPNRTVVTALGQDRMQSGVVTNIDSTVIVNDPDGPDGVAGRVS